MTSRRAETTHAREDVPTAVNDIDAYGVSSGYECLHNIFDDTTSACRLMYDTVLVTTDGSDVSLNAAEEAIAFTASDGTLHALSVVEELPLHTQSGKGAKLGEKDRSAERAALEEAINRIEKMADGAGLDCVTTMTEGVPYREILEYAADVDAKVIVMGKRGSGAAARDMLGSTTERVVKRASSTVVTVPEP